MYICTIHILHILYTYTIDTVYLYIPTNDINSLEATFQLSNVPPAASSGSRSSTSKVHGKPEFFGKNGPAPEN